MQFVVTAVGPDNRGLADPIVHSLTELGANIAEIQMFDHDEQSIFSMQTRVELSKERADDLKIAMQEAAGTTGLSIRTWTPDIQGRKPRLAICVTYRPECGAALLGAIADGSVPAEATVLLSNRKKCKHLSDEFGVPWQDIGKDDGTADDNRMIAICDELEIDYIILARYMRVLPASSCWSYAGGRIINLHHGLLPGFPGMRPYDDAYANRMLTFGATCHFIVPELDAGNQIINQSTFAVAPGTPLEEIIRQGQADNEPRCLVEGVRRVVENEVRLHFHRVVATHA